MTSVRCVAMLGPRGAGKSTLGRRLAEHLAWQALDGDDLLARRVGMPAADYLARAGEPAFRTLEAEVTVLALARANRTVLALGGGAVLAPAVQTALRVPSVLPVLLLAAVPVLVERQRQAPRPPLLGRPLPAEVEALMADRLPLYRALGRLEIDTGSQDPESCVRIIVDALRRLP